MANVTVLGAGGATVTISLSSADNAAAAQTAVNFVNKLTTSGIVDQQVWSGVGTLRTSRRWACASQSGAGVASNEEHGVCDLADAARARSIISPSLSARRT